MPSPSDTTRVILDEAACATNRCITHGLRLDLLEARMAHVEELTGEQGKDIKELLRAVSSISATLKLQVALMVPVAGGLVGIIIKMFERYLP